VSIHVEYVKSRLGGAARWRKGLIAQYPQDRRIQIAEKLLQELSATDPADVSPEIKEALRPYTGPAFVQAVNDTARLVGFRILPVTLDDFLRAVLRRLEAQSTADDASLAAMIGGVR
jgi:hypothetical protein